MNSKEGNKMQVGLMILILCMGALVFVIWEGVQTRNVKESQDKAVIEEAVKAAEAQKTALEEAKKALNEALAAMKEAQGREILTPTPPPNPVTLPQRIIVEIRDNRTPKPAPVTLPPGHKTDKKALRK